MLDPLNCIYLYASLGLLPLHSQMQVKEHERLLRVIAMNNLNLEIQKTGGI